MHVLFVHKSFPAQFGHIAGRLIEQHGYRCSFATEEAKTPTGRVERILYRCSRVETKANHAASRGFENSTWRSHAVLQALQCRPDVQPDVIVGHSGFGSTLFLKDHYKAPIVNFCEWFYRRCGSDVEFDPTARSTTGPLTDRCRDALLLADLDACTLGYSPFNWQRSQIPHEYQHKVETIFDGIDTSFWRPLKLKERGARRISGKKLPKTKRIVTYVSRGFESMRGFDIFMQIAQRICELRSDVVFLVIGSDRVVYGGDLSRIPEKSFREHVLNSGRFDEDRFIFTGRIPPQELVRAFHFSDLHVYLTVPFVLSWSLIDALACGCSVLVADTPPLREVIEHGQNGLMAPYYDVDHFVELALEVLDDPVAYRRGIGMRGIETIHQRYSLDVVLPKMIRLYERAINGDVPKPGSVDASGDEEGNGRGQAQFAPKTPQIEPIPVRSMAGRRGRNGGTGQVKGTGTNLLRRLCKIEPVPEAKTEPAPDGGWLSSDEVVALNEMIPTTAKRILELGAWRGQTTAFLADHCPNAEIVAVDTWHGGSIRSEEHPDWKSMLPQVWESFSSRVSHLRDRVIPIRQNHDDAVRKLAEANTPFDVIYYDPDYNSKLVRETLQAVLRHYPDTLLIGHDWYWHGLRNQLAPFAQRTGRPLVARGNLWRLEPALARQAKGTGTICSEDCANRTSPRTPQFEPVPCANSATERRPRILLTIPHYYRQDASRFYGSSTDARQQRVVALRSCLGSYLQTFAGSAYTACLAHPDNRPANTTTKADVQIVLCVHGNDHVLADLSLPTRNCEVRQVDGDPLYLGYACHEVLRDRLGDFDYYVYSEDDLVLSDEWTLAKLRWFASIAPKDSLLQANRYELANDGIGRKAYIDGELDADKTARYQDVTDHPEIDREFLGSRIRFRRTLNPHAGCFFLTDEQMRHWSQQPYFLDRDASFYSPLEGAATVGIMRTFRTYKPAAENANFFEIRHMGDAMMRRIAARDQAVLSRTDVLFSRTREFEQTTHTNPHDLVLGKVTDVAWPCTKQNAGN